MAEGNESNTDDSQKTEEPTARKLEEARKRGQVISSREVTSWAILFTATILILFAGPGIMSDMTDVLKKFIEQAHDLPSDGGGLKMLLQSLFFEIGKLLILPLMLLAVVAVFSVLIQTGPLLTFEPLKPDISKISIIKGFGRLFSMKAIVELIKGVFKMIVVSAAIYIAMRPFFEGVEHFVGLELPQAMFDFETLFMKMMIATLIVLFFIALADYLYQRYDFMQKMRMSKQEVRDEYKQSEGDPQVKAKLRQLREAKARSRMMQAVPEADVVITNPTHYAVALKYDSKEMQAPVMVAKGADLIAARIKELAKENKVPVIENAPLARALYDSMEIDQVIPAQHWKAVAEVISYVFRLKGKKL